MFSKMNFNQCWILLLLIGGLALVLASESIDEGFRDDINSALTRQKRLAEPEPGRGGGFGGGRGFGGGFGGGRGFGGGFGGGRGFGGFGGRGFGGRGFGGGFGGPRFFGGGFFPFVFIRPRPYYYY